MKYPEDFINKIICGDCLEVVKQMPDNSIDCIITSPPYWALRDYGVKGQLGLEPTFQEYITKLCDIFDEVKRVLKKEGTCWVNIADAYSGTGHKKDSRDPKYANGRNGQSVAMNNKTSVPDKCLCCIPDRFKIEMVNRGWICRNEIIWHKPNCMPSSVKDRFTVDFEKIFFFVKSKKYYFETQYEEMAESTIRKATTSGYIVKNGKSIGTNGGYAVDHSVDWKPSANGRNKRCVFQINAGYMRLRKDLTFATKQNIINEMIKKDLL